MKTIIKFIATVFFIGYIPFASGTFGSLIGAFIWIIFSRLIYYRIIIIVLLILGTLVSDYAEKNIFKRDDPSEVVIDEVVGILISYIFFKFIYDLNSLKVLILGFAIFRFFDILKPQPIKLLQRLPGGIGIMIDDIVAGAFTSILLILIRITGFIH